jgi:lipopolysaccharide transport system ATP-binding protein
LNPEILVVDEVLSVGDTQFQKKCIGKMQDVANSGRTVLFVSHNMAVIQQLCEYGLFLEQGKVKAQATVGEIVSQYNAVGNVSRMGSFNAQNRSGSGWARVKSIKIVDQQNQEIDFVTNDADLIFHIELSVSETSKADKLRGLLFEIMFYTDTGDPVTSVTNVDSPRLDLPSKDSCQIQMRLPGPTFVPGRYRINTFLGFPFKEHVDEVFDALVFDILPPVIPWRPYDLHAIRGNVCRKAEWTYI